MPAAPAAALVAVGMTCTYERKREKLREPPPFKVLLGHSETHLGQRHCPVGGSCFEAI